MTASVQTSAVNRFPKLTRGAAIAIALSLEQYHPFSKDDRCAQCKLP
jgi:hypothetical protein